MFNKLEYVWVEGYKATNTDMTCKGFQYEMNKTIEFEGEPVTRNCGFHISLDLKDTIEFYKPDTSRYFKVRALVKKEDLFQKTHNHYADSYAGKKIEFLEEVSFEELLPFINLPDGVSDEDEYNKYKKFGRVEYFKNKFINGNELFTPEFLGLVYDEKITYPNINSIKTLKDKLQIINDLDCSDECKYQLCLALGEINDR